MKKIIPLFLISIVFSISQSYGQEPNVKIKKDIALVNGKVCLKIQSSWTNCTMIDKEGNDILYFQSYLETNTHPAYSKIIFLQEKKTITNYSAFFTRKNLIKRLIMNKILVDCRLNPENMDLFALKYHEEIPTTINININN